VGPQVGRYTLLKYFMVTEDSTYFITWLEKMPGSLPRYFAAETFRRHGNLAAAESLLTELLRHRGDVSPQAVRLSLARLRFQQGDAPGAEAEYWKAVQDIRSPLGSAILFEDLKYIVSDGELEYYRNLDSVGRQRDFFRSFWNFRNPSLALAPTPGYGSTSAGSFMPSRHSNTTARAPHSTTPTGSMSSHSPGHSP